MTTLRLPRRSLAGGEVDPELIYATDLIPIRNGLGLCKNFVVRTKGGIERRPGTEFLFKAAANDAVRLKPFVRSDTAAYIMEFTDTWLRCYTADCAPGAAPVGDLATAIPAARLGFLQTAQSKDVQWVVTGSSKPINVTRTSVNSFTVGDADLKNGPFIDEALGLPTITASALEGNVTLTAGAAVFEAGHVGSYWRLDERDYSSAAIWGANVSVSAGQLVRYDGNVYEALTTGTTSSAPPEHERGDQFDKVGGINWRYRHSGYGIVQITGFTSATQVTAYVEKRLPEQLTSGTTRWREAAWSNVAGWPAALCLFSRSLWFAGSVRDPHFLWKSTIEGFNDFELGVEDDSAVARGLYDGETEEIRWLSPGTRLTIGTNGPEWIARALDQGDTIRPGNLRTEIATGEGASHVPGITVGGRAIFIDGSLRRLMASGYDYRADAFVAVDLSLVAPHLLGSGIIEMVYQRRPQPIFWCLRADGKVAAVTYLPNQEVQAWHWHDFGDPVLSLAVLPRPDGSETLVLAIRRDGEICIERMFPFFSYSTGDGIKDARFLDSAKLYEPGAPATVFGGLDHLEGRQVIALVDGYAHPPMTVTGGQVELDFPGSTVLIGLSVRSEVETLPPDHGQPDDFATGRPLTASDLTMALRATMGGFLERVRDGQTERERVFPLGDTPLDVPPPLYTGARKIAPLSSADGRVRYVNDTPWPATITAIYTEDQI